MDSPHASALTGEELLSFALDENALPAEKQAHLQECPVCQQRLAAYTRLDEALAARFYRRFCPDAMQISLYCEDLLPADERMRLASHILDCPLCAAEVAETRRFMRDAPLKPEAGFAPLSAARRVIGVLTRQQAQLVTRGEESTMPENAWPRQYRADSLDLSLHLTRASNGDQLLLGILTGAGNEESVDMFEGARAELCAGSFLTDIEQPSSLQSVRQTQVDDLGNLVFSAVPNGHYVLVIHLPDQDVIFEQITIEQR
jgi:anti-sigma factor RsiW